MNNKIVCIYPTDSTTNFLENIPIELSSTFNADFELIRIVPSDESHDEAIAKIKSLPNGSICLFIGHGSSFALKGAEVNDYKKEIFIDYNQLSIFNNKSLFVLACRSYDLLDYAINYDSVRILQSISFPNIISSWEELEHERKVKQKKLYPNLTLDQINKFNEILVESTIYSLKGLKENQDFHKIYRRLIHFLNQKMAEIVLIDPIDANRDLADMIFEFKKEIVVLNT